jgi:hypothetical protein
VELPIDGDMDVVVLRWMMMEELLGAWFLFTCTCHYIDTP